MNKTQAEENAELEVAAACWRGIGRSFRGEIYDYARTITLGSGYLGDWSLTNLCRNCRAKGGIRTCRHFEIDTARHLIGPFKAILDPNVRIMMLLKAAQTAGSLVWDLSVHYLLVHSPYMRIKVLMDCEEKARIYCQQRLMETLRENPDIAPLLPTGADRFGVTDTEMRLLNGKTLFVGGLNETNASSLPADVMILDESWLHQADGLTKKAVNRVKQSQKRGKLIIVGQAGNKGEDQDVIWEGLNIRVPLTWACPHCHSRQAFGLRGPSVLRPNDFKPILLDGVEPPKPETYAGLLTKKRHNEVSAPEEIEAAAVTAYLECFHCEHQMPDTREIREAINSTFEQEYRQKLPNGTFYTPKNYSVGFWQPDPASMFVPWKSTMKEYIVAKKADDDFKNKVPLQDFFKANWALPWDEDLIKVIRARMQEKYDAQSDWPEEWRGRRSLIVDCQHELQHFWGSAWAVSKTGKSRQLWRGLMRTFGDAKTKTTWTPASNETPTVTDVQKHFGVLDQRVFLDAGYMKNELVDECAKHGHWAKFDGEMAWYCWTLLVGSAQKDFQHLEEQNPKMRFPVSDPFYETPTFKVDNKRVEVEVFYFSKLQMSQMFARYRDGNGPETLFLQETENPTNQLSWTAQINSCTAHYEFSKKTGEATEIWKAQKQSIPTHYFDVGTMFMAVHCLWEISGHRQFAEPPAVETTK